MGPNTLRLGHKLTFCYIIITIIWVLTYVSANNDKLEGAGVQGDNTTCTLPACKKMARIIKRQMGNETPCEEFSNYVCGNWKGHTELKPTRLKVKAVTTLAGLLKNASESEEGDNATNKLIRAFQSCRKMGKDKQALRASILYVIAGYNVTNRTWPIINDTKNTSTRQESDAFVEVLKKTGPRPVFSFFVSKQNGEPYIHLTKPSDFYVIDVEKSDYTIMSDPEGASESTTVDYKHYDDLAAQDQEAYKKFIRETILFLNELYSEEEAEEAAEDIIYMEKGFSRLANAAIKEDERKLNISDLGNLVDKNFPMAEILGKDFEDLNIEVKENTTVIVRYIEYFKNAVKFMKCNYWESLYNYIMWTKIRTMGEAEGTWLHKLFLEFKRNSSIYNLTDVEDPYKGDGADGKKKLYLRCMLQLLESNVMYTAGANYYIKAKFHETSKQEVLKMMYFVNSSFVEIVENNTWMTQHTKNAVLNRLHQTDSVIGYPDWMLNDTIINSSYQFVPLIGASVSFVRHFHYLLENDFKQNLLMLDSKRYINKKNEDVVLRSHAYMNERTHTLAYPAAALVTHFREPPIPKSINFGTIGTILAQLLTLIMERYHYGFNGIEKYNNDTWDRKTTEHFCNRSSCLNNTDECNDTIVPSRNKHEKLTDYLGMRISHQAMLKSKTNYTPPYLLPDKNGIFNSEEKIFFLAVGSLYCPYSVNENRVNETPVASKTNDKKVFNESLDELVYTYRDFNITFNCSLFEGVDSCTLMPGDKPTPPPAC